MKVLLIEPGYLNKYPPLGLMKISTFHKSKGDEVVFYKGNSEELKRQKWDRIYIASLFTFHYNKTLDSIKFYINSVSSPKDLYVGGVLATLKKDEIEKETSVSVITGLLDTKRKLGYEDDDVIDCLTPDYSIINKSSNPFLNYDYPTNDSYISYATRGCIRKCRFCAVPIIEGNFHNSYSLVNQVKSIEANYGTKKNLLLLDNNILAAGEHFFNIIEDIISLGFGKGAKLPLNINGKIVSVVRYVDFNQGIDARLLVKDKRFIKAISRIAIKPLRIAFDDIKDKEVYIKSVRMAAEHGIKIMSNYILYNYKDTPEDFYERLRINIELNEEFIRNGIESRVWSFPMRYSPINGENSKDRKFLGKYWTRKQLRGIQNILSATHGVVGPKKPFFLKAFGDGQEEFKEILLLPEYFIINRNLCIENGSLDKLRSLINSLSKSKKKKIFKIIYSNEFREIDLKALGLKCKKILKIFKRRK
jgi:radical SAM superfamily enzyme YgiQ (UPF0313 family)